LSGPDAPRPPYGVQIAADGTVYIADTAEHRIRAYTPSGQVHASVSEGLFYPNGMWRDSGQLWVANTEDEQIVSVATRPELGAEVARSAYDRDPEGSNRRPIELAPVGDQWWVVEIAGRLVGESVARFDNDWQPIGSLDLSEAAQPTTLVPRCRCAFRSAGAAAVQPRTTG